MPRIAELIVLFKPVGLLMLVYPMMIGFCHWRYSRSSTPSAIHCLTHLLLFGFSIVFLTAVLVGSSLSRYMNGTQPINTLQIVGNIVIGCGLFVAIWRSFVSRSEDELRA